jgi:predicted transcriptional regulator
MIERLYEEVLEEGAILDWIKDNKGVVKQLLKELSMMGLLFGSAGSMGIYVSNFLTKNFPNLPEQTLSKIAQFISDNPQILDLIKS